MCLASENVPGCDPGALLAPGPGATRWRSSGYLQVMIQGMSVCLYFREQIGPPGFFLFLHLGLHIDLRCSEDTRSGSARCGARDWPMAARSTRAREENLRSAGTSNSITFVAHLPLPKKQALPPPGLAVAFRDPIHCPTLFLFPFRSCHLIV